MKLRFSPLTVKLTFIENIKSLKPQSFLSLLKKSSVCIFHFSKHEVAQKLTENVTTDLDLNCILSSYRNRRALFYELCKGNNITDVKLTLKRKKYWNFK